ncbi:MAG: nucleotide sugar dehydrogenase [Alcanivorax sp.]|nr:nucleotide sugar dehydrogenase [Alcanivorax sp.]
MHLNVYGDTLCALVTATAMASSGHQVVLRSAAGAFAEALQGGESLYREPGLAKLLKEQLDAGRLRWGALDEPPAPEVRALFMAFEQADEPVARDVLLRLAEQMAGRTAPSVVINQSAFPVGTTEELQMLFPVGSVVCLPEFLQEGAAVQSFVRPARLLLGCDNERAELLVREVFRPFNRLSDHFLVMRPREAEFAKLAITGMLATRVSFMNDMANLADTLGVDIEQVRRGVGSDPRIGEAYLYPGCGFGGPGLSQNVISLSDTLAASGVGSELLTQVLRINERQKEVMFRKLWRHYDTALSGRVVAVWGAAFKPGTGRIDNAPILKLLEALWAQGVTVRVHDPEALPALRETYGARDDLILCDEPYLAAEGADALMLVTEWKAYWSPDFERLSKIMRAPLILDGRNIYDPAFVRQSGFTYYGVGR